MSTTPAAYQLLASDYTEARWVSFIGLLRSGDAFSAPTTDFRLTSNGGRIALGRRARAVWIKETGFALNGPDDQSALAFQLLLVCRPEFVM